MSRKNDLENDIHETYNLISEYDEIVRNSSDPRERTRARREIEKQWKLIEDYLKEYRPLAANELPPDIAEMAAHFLPHAPISPSAPIQCEAFASAQGRNVCIGNFGQDILKDYESCLDSFFDPESRAVREFEREDRTPPFLYTEATGYAILDLILLHSITGNERYLRNAKESADWIQSQALDLCGGVRTRHYLGHDRDPKLAGKSFHGRRIFSFDTAICLKAFVSLFNVIKDAPDDREHDLAMSYRESAIKMGEFLVNQMVTASGEVHAIYDAKAEKPVAEEPAKWSEHFGAFHTKVAEALVDLSFVTGEKKYLDTAERICERALELRFQRPRGNFETSVGLTELHPHCYAAEGLLYVGRKMHREEFTRAAWRATEWALGKSQNGEIAQVFDASTGEALSLLRADTGELRILFRTDALAQTLALAADLLPDGQLDQNDVRKMDEIAGKILDMKDHPDRWFRYGFYEKEINGKFEAETKSYWTSVLCLCGLFKYYLSYILDHTRVFILGGGVGSRCWPISCETRPKPLSFSLGDHSILQETIRRYTDNDLFKPGQIFIYCSERGREEAQKQLREEKDFPQDHIVAEEEPEGTIRAVSKMAEKLSQQIGRGDITIVSMADDIIEPREQFQSALIAALFVAQENECIVSVAKPIDKNQADAHDKRFGHMVYAQRIEPYRCYQVDQFVEKPGRPAFDALRGLPGQIAWECGTVLFQKAYFDQVVPKGRLPDEKKDLATGLLPRAAGWSSGEQNALRMALSTLDAQTRFEDLGVPGPQVRKFFGGKGEYDLGSGNVRLGEDPQKATIQTLVCSNNLIISGQLPIKIYGIEDCLIIDNDYTNTTVLMPLNEVDQLPTLYRLFERPIKYQPFFKGGDEALDAPPVAFALNSPQAETQSEYGLVLVYNYDGKVWVDRREEGLRIFNRQLPAVEPDDYPILLDKQETDPKLVEHLVHTAALAEYFHGDGIILTGPAQEMLRLLCLYHDFGGWLSEDGEKKEEEIVTSFGEISNLDRRRLDSRIITELLKDKSGPSLADDPQVGLLNDSVNSAVEFIRHRKGIDKTMRDIIAFLLQIQDSPGLFADFKNSIDRKKFGFDPEEVERAFACLKIADTFTNGRWWWKRTRPPDFLQRGEGALEDFPFIISFIVEWFQQARIEPGDYVRRLNRILEDHSPFLKLIKKLQENRPLLVCDKIYRRLLRTKAMSGDEPKVLFISDERSAWRWLWHFLETPKTYKDIHTAFVQVPQMPGDNIPKLITLLEDDFIRTDGRGKSEVLDAPLQEIEEDDPIHKDKHWKRLELKDFLENSINEILSHQDQSFQLSQILQLPYRLKDIQPYCGDITKESVNLVAEAVIDKHHEHRRAIRPLLDRPEIVAHLQEWEPLP